MLRAVLGVALLVIAGLLAFFLAGGTLDVDGAAAQAGHEQPWSVGDHLQYVETVQRTDVTPRETTEFPSGPVDLHWFVVEVGDTATVLTQRTWHDVNGAREHWGRLDLEGQTPVGQRHPWTLPGMAPGDSWSTGVGLLPTDGNQTVSRVVRAEHQDVLGHEELVFIIYSEQRRDGTLQRNDTMAYAPDVGAIVSWRTQTWSSEPYQSSTWVREWTLVAKDLQVPEDVPTSIESEVLDPVVHNRTFGGDPDAWVRAFATPWAPARVYAWAPWNDPWGLIEDLQWTLTHRHSNAIATHDELHFSVLLKDPGQYRLHLRLDGAVHVVVNHTFAVGVEQDIDWTCGPTIDTWCEGPRLDLLPGWSRLEYAVHNDGEVRLLDQHGTIIHEGQDALFTEGHHPELEAITPQWRQITAGVTVRAGYTLSFYDDW